jgi:DNA topoisomerase VI subunit B
MRIHPGAKLEKESYNGGFVIRVLASLMTVIFLCSASFWSCSRDKEKESKKGAIEKMTEKAGKDIADRLQKPIKQARSVKKKQEEKSKEIEKALKGQ